MVQIVGTYNHVRDSPNFETYLRELGVTEASLPKVLSLKPTLTVSENNGQWTFQHSQDGNSWSSTFKEGEPYDERTYDGRILKSVTRREGDKFIVESTAQGLTNTRTYEFSDAGINVHLEHPKATTVASAEYKRA